jgi:hypothetical protein
MSIFERKMSWAWPEEHLGLATASFCHWPSHERFTCFSRGHWNIANKSVLYRVLQNVLSRELQSVFWTQIELFCLGRPERKQ